MIRFFIFGSWKCTLRMLTVHISLKLFQFYWNWNRFSFIVAKTLIWPTCTKACEYKHTTTPGVWHLHRRDTNGRQFLHLYWKLPNSRKCAFVHTHTHTHSFFKALMYNGVSDVFFQGRMAAANSLRQPHCSCTRQPPNSLPHPQPNDSLKMAFHRQGTEKRGRNKVTKKHRLKYKFACTCADLRVHVCACVCVCVCVCVRVHSQSMHWI